MSRLLLALVLLAPAGCLVDKPTTAAAAKKKVLTRDEFKKLVIGKTADEVKALLGPPESTSDAPSGGQMWMYERVTIDPANGKTDDAATIFFDRTDGLAFKVLH